MFRAIPDYKLLMEYEQGKRDGDTDISVFAKEHKITPQLQLELIGLDIEIRLKIGDIVRVEDYHLDFPHLLQKIPQVFWEVRDQFLANYCPITDRFGKLPVKFDGYQIESEIGRGGMGVVYRAVDIETSQACALKVLFVNRGLAHEAEALERIDHRNICHFIEVGSFEKTPFLCTKEIKGQTLKKLLREREFLHPAEAAGIIAKLASGFQSVHDSGVVHYDIKLSNVLIDSAGEPIALDFGLARIEGAEIESDEVFGSPSYFAPEMLDSKFGTPGKTSDVYCLGVALYELLTGFKPFWGNVTQLFDQICNCPPSRPSDFRDRNIDAELEAICLNAMKKNVSERTPSMKAMEESLHNWMATKCQQAI